MKQLVPVALLLTLLLLPVPACGTRATGPFFEKLETKELANAIIYLYAGAQIGPIITQRIYPIKANGVPVAKVPDGGYYPFRVAQGVVTFDVEGHGTPTIPVTLQVEGGQTYFVKAIQWGGGRYGGAKIELKLLSEDEAINDIAMCRLIVIRCTETDPTLSSAPCFYIQ